ncbi:MAG: hypothetical protein GXO43_06005 [Crenarchaeota archaeon]|nr:hypothetical protein [Thermoproteota archaeon]
MVRVEVDLRLVVDVDEETAKLLMILPAFDRDSLAQIVSKLIAIQKAQIGIQVKKHKEAGK